MTFKQYTLQTISFITLMASQALSAATNEELEQRVIELENRINQLLEQKDETSQVQDLLIEDISQSYDDLNERLDTSIKVAGYADIEYRGSSQSGKNEEFRMHHLSLFFTKRFDNNFKFFSEIEYEDTPQFSGTNDGTGNLDTAEGKIFVEAVNFDWNYSQEINFRAGRFFTPAGIWSEDHYPPYVTTQERPLHIRKIFPQLVDGLSTFGSIKTGHNTYFDYTVYLGNGESSVSGKKDLNSSKATGIRGNYNAPIFDEFTVGFSYYQDGNDTANNNADKEAYGLHFKSRYRSFTAQFEYAEAELDLPLPDLSYDRKGYYLQLSYNVNQWDLGVRNDHYDQTNLDIEKVNRNSLFVNYLVNENIKLKGEYHYDQHDDPLIDNFGFYIFSITAFLGE